MDSVQSDAKDKDTFMPKVISLPKDAYASMVQSLRLPYRGIETTAVVGPFFWCAYDQDDDDPHLRKSKDSMLKLQLKSSNLTCCGGGIDILHRKSDVRKKGKTRGWEMMLSHSFRQNITTGYVKGTPSSDVVKALEHLKACAGQIGHPMLLPVIILSHDLSPVNDQKQRDARDWLRRLENAVSLRNEVEEHEQYFQDGMLDVDGLNRDLVECHSHVLWKRPQAYMALTLEMEAAMVKFNSKWQHNHDISAVDMSLDSSGTVYDDSEYDPVAKKHKSDMIKLHRSMSARLDFYKVKLKGLENYIHTTLQRLKVQREAVRRHIFFFPIIAKFGFTNTR